MTLREALEEKVKYWRGCLKRPPAYRCAKCPDGDYKWASHGEPHEEKTLRVRRHKRTGKEYTVEETIMVDPPLEMTCDKCGYVPPREEVPMSIGPLFSWGSAAELESVCEELEKLLKENA